MGRHTTWVLLMVGMALTGCLGTPVPEPPNVAPIDLADLHDTGDESDTPEVNGLPGAVQPGQEIWAWNLETNEPPTVTGARLDGSFQLVIEHFAGDELRLQVRAEEGRSLPTDIIAIERSGPFGAPSRTTCLEVETMLELRGTGEAALRGRVSLTHHCAETVELQNIRWRRDLGDLTVSTPSSGIIPMGAEVEIEVFASSAGPGIEDILLLDFQLGGVPERRAISIHTSRAP